MNDLFECTSEGPDAKICDLTITNLKKFETDLTPDQCAYFFNLFSMMPVLLWMNNQLVGGNEEDWWVYIRLKLKSLVS